MFVYQLTAGAINNLLVENLSGPKQKGREYSISLFHPTPLTF
jgi:hypothetical protein